jgi:hypothetical protein
MRPQPLGDDALALRGRVDAVGLVESGVAGHAVQQEGRQRVIAERLWPHLKALLTK